MENITVCTKHKNVDENLVCQHAIETNRYSSFNDAYAKAAEVYPYVCKYSCRCNHKQTIQIYEEGDE